MVTISELDECLGVERIFSQEFQRPRNLQLTVYKSPITSQEFFDSGETSAVDKAKRKRNVGNRTNKAAQTTTKMNSECEEKPKKKRKRKNCDVGEGEGEDKDDENESQSGFKTRMCPSRFSAFVKDLKKGQRQSIEEIGFSGMLHCTLTMIPGDLAHWLASNIFPFATKMVLGSEELKITEQDMHVSVGLPIGMETVVEGGKRKKSEKYMNAIREWGMQWPETGYESVTSTQLMSKMKEQTEGGRLFKINFILYVVTMFLKGQQNNRVSFRVLESVVDVENIVNMNWSQFALKSLADGAAAWQKKPNKHFKGPIIPLILIYMDRVVFKIREVPRTFPLLKAWTKDEVAKRISAEKHEGGGFGMGSVDVIFDKSSYHSESRSRADDMDEKKARVQRMAEGAKLFASGFAMFVDAVQEARDSFPNSEVVTKMHSLAGKMLELYSEFERHGNGFGKAESESDAEPKDPKFWEAMEELERSLKLSSRTFGKSQCFSGPSECYEAGTNPCEGMAYSNPDYEHSNLGTPPCEQPAPSPEDPHHNSLGTPPCEQPAPAPSPEDPHHNSLGTPPCEQPAPSPEDPNPSPEDPHHNSLGTPPCEQPAPSPENPHHNSPGTPPCEQPAPSPEDPHQNYDDTESIRQPLEDHNSVRRNTELPHELDISKVNLEGVVFESEAEAFHVYNDYAYRMGFSCRKSKTRRRSRSEQISMRQFCCWKEGHKADKGVSCEKSYTKLDFRTGCKAMIQFSIDKEGVYTVTKHNIEHNHDPCPSEQRHYLPSHRMMTKNHLSYVENLVKSGVGYADAVRCLKKEAGGSPCLPFT